MNMSRFSRDKPGNTKYSGRLPISSRITWYVTNIPNTGSPNMRENRNDLLHLQDMSVSHQSELGIKKLGIFL